MNKFEFICGSAGTGKTFLARQRLNDISRGCVLTATTGIAAVNLGDATTINSLLKYYDTKSLKESYENGDLDIRLCELSGEEGIKEIIIDEVSMLSADQLDIICAALDFHNTNCITSEIIALTLVGDFLQLAPVKAPFAFEAKVWHKFARNTKKLTKVHRQSDQDFINALLAARRGNGEDAADFFEPRFVNTIDTEFAGSTVMAKNAEVNAFNERRLAQLPSEPCHYYSDKSGKQLSEWKNIPDILTVKAGALVMILSNKYNIDKSLLYVNGDLATFVSYVDSETAEVKLLRTGETVTIKNLTRQNNEVIKKVSTTVGEVKYMPIRLAFATSIHKSQGLTLDNVQINLRNPFIKFPGMMYVALSRARTSEGIRLVGTAHLMKDRCRTDPKVEKWL